MLLWLATLYSCTCNYQGGKTGDSNICTVGVGICFVASSFPLASCSKEYLHVSVL